MQVINMNINASNKHEYAPKYISELAIKLVSLAFIADFQMPLLLLETERRTAMNVPLERRKLT